MMIPIKILEAVWRKHRPTMSLEQALVVLIDHQNERSYWWEPHRICVWKEALRIVREAADDIVREQEELRHD